jgi:hypothetical protein
MTRVDLSRVKYVITSPLSLGRVLWWYGEDELWPAATELPPSAVADLARRFAELHAAPEVMELLWPGAPLQDAHLALGTIEHLEGRARPAARRHRRGGPLPPVLDVSEDLRWRDPALVEVLRLVDERAGFSPTPTTPLWRRYRAHGRYASG